MRFKLNPIVQLGLQVPNVQELFTEMKELIPLPRYRTVKVREIREIFGLFEIFDFFFGKLEISLIFRPQLNFGTPCWAKLLHFMGFTKVIWNF